MIRKFVKFILEMLQINGFKMQNFKTDSNQGQFKIFFKTRVLQSFMFLLCRHTRKFTPTCLSSSIALVQYYIKCLMEIYRSADKHAAHVATSNTYENKSVLTLQVIVTVFNPILPTGNKFSPLLISF